MSLQGIKNAKFASIVSKARAVGDFRAISMVLILIIVGMLLLWRPWEPIVRTVDRTISVTGSATLSAAPDQYTFSPTYTFTNSDKQSALNDLTTRSDQLVTELKKLGVPSGDIRTNASGSYDYGYYVPIDTGSNTYTLSLTIVLQDANLAQKIQDYLVSTSPSGSITPDVSFSVPKQQALQNDARDIAERDARAQAEQSAKNLGFRISSVKSVADGNLDTGSPIIYGNAVGALSVPSKPQLSLQPGQNNLNYSVQVVYYIR